MQVLFSGSLLIWQKADFHLPCGCWPLLPATTVSSDALTSDEEVNKEGLHSAWEATDRVNHVFDGLP